MANSLAFTADAGKTARIGGLALLAHMEQTIKTVGALQPREAQGTAAKPLKLTSARQWLWAISNYKIIARGQAMIYINLAGRLIGGKSDCYVGDCGPVWRKGVEPTVGDAGISDDDALAKWRSNQKMGDPTYQTIAQRVQNPQRVFNTPTTMTMLPNVAPPDLRAWTDISRTPVIVAAIRKIMEAGDLFNSPEVMSAFKQYARMQKLLPPLVAAMFLAEPARNPRAWPINMMLLDLVEAGQAFGPIGAQLDWVNTIWHPLALEVSRQNPAHSADPVPGNPVLGPSGQDAKEREVGQIDRLGALHLVGGAMPASPTGGGKYGKIEIKSTNERQLQTFVKQRKFDYIHQKEIDVLLAWLARRVPGATLSDEEGNVNFDGLLNSTTIPDTDLRRAVGNAKPVITSKISTRIDSLQYIAV